MSTPPRIALVAGANGMVGRELLRVLAASNDYSRVIALTRRPLGFEAPRLVNRILRFEQMEQELRTLACHDAYCCLGTTRAAATSGDTYASVDRALVLRFAACAQSLGARCLVVVSSVGADAASGNDYLRTKGEVEAALEQQRWASLNLLRPGLLLGRRREARPLELLGGMAMQAANPLLRGRFARWRAVPASEVAAAMAAAARVARPGCNRIEWRELQSLALRGRFLPRV